MITPETIQLNNRLKQLHIPEETIQEIISIVTRLENELLKVSFELERVRAEYIDAQKSHRELQEDKARLDFLESAHIALNNLYNTNYGWELIINHNIVRFMAGHSYPRDSYPGIDLHDSKGGCAKLQTCREAIDKHLPTDR
jgi:hypothetical protein